MSGFGHWLSQVTRQAGIEPTRIKRPERMRRQVEAMQRRLVAGGHDEPCDLRVCGSCLRATNCGAVAHVGCDYLPANSFRPDPDTPCANCGHYAADHAPPRFPGKCGSCDCEYYKLAPKDPGTFLALANIGRAIALALEHGNGTVLRGAMIELD